MKILVIGSNGMAGHVITKYLKSKNYDVVTLARDNADYSLDIENVSLTETFFKERSDDFDYVINCIGLLVKESNDRLDRALIINSWFPHHLEHVFRTSHTKVIHLSTDCVFDGTRGNYIETDSHTETNYYGRSKSLGELNNSKDITFRMSIIGPEIKSNGTGLFNWIYKNTDIDIPGWDNALWNGITTLELAKCIEKYINSPTITGVYHLVSNNNCISKFDLLKKINLKFNLGKNIIQTSGPKTINKVLIDTRQEFNFNIVDYDSMLDELKEYVYSGS